MPGNSSLALAPTVLWLRLKVGPAGTTAFWDTICDNFIEPV